MKIHTDGFDLKLLPARQRDEEDWARVLISVSVTGFTGEFEAWIQVEDLRRFSVEMAHLYENAGQGGEARLVSAEPDINVHLRINQRGHIQAVYSFESERIEGVPTVLSGRFEMDQSYLPEVRRSVNELIAELLL
ncbi:MAG: hypothetical protein WC291_04135 [Thermodesulfovibrionales bacterium]|jgi:hypothetical protein